MGEPIPVAASKVTALLRGLETYVSGQADLIIDYAKARRGGEPISTATAEHGAVAAASSDGRRPADALVGEGRASHAAGPHRRCERHPPRGPCRRRAVGPPAVPPRRLTANFWTVSRADAKRRRAGM